MRLLGLICPTREARRNQDLNPNSLFDLRENRNHLIELN